MDYVTHHHMQPFHIGSHGSANLSRCCILCRLQRAYIPKHMLLECNINLVSTTNDSWQAADTTNKTVMAMYWRASMEHQMRPCLLYRHLSICGLVDLTF